MVTWTYNAPRGGVTEAILALRGAFYAVGAFSFAVNLLMLAPAIYMLQIYDRVLASRNEATLLMLTVIMVGLFVLEAALELVRSRVLIRISAAIDMRLNGRVFDAGFARFLAGRGGNPGQALGDLGTIRQFLTGRGLFAFFDAPWTPIFILVIFLLHPWLGAFALLAALALFALAYANERAVGPLLDEAGLRASAANHYAAANLRNAEVVDAMGMLPALRRRWFARQIQYLSCQGQASDRAASIAALTRFFRLTLQSGILGFGALLVIQNQLTPGGMIAASILLGRALAPVDLAISTWRAVVAARASHARLNELLAQHPASEAIITLPRPAGTIAVDDLLLGAPGSRTPILKGVNFRVSAGMTVAVVGPSASGKSSLARALVGVWAPMSGAVRLDGAEVHKWDKTQLGPWIGYLPQDIELFEGTVAENIARFGELDSGRVVQAAQRAGMHDLVLRLPQGYDTPIGDGGMAISGGQRQRIALARALYGDPALIVLDEPNASLDDAGDAALIAALRATKEERRTVFVMTNRVNVLSVADAVMVMGGGSVQGFGPRDAALKALAAKSQPAVEAPKDRPAAGEESS